MATEHPKGYEPAFESVYTRICIPTQWQNDGFVPSAMLPGLDAVPQSPFIAGEEGRPACKLDKTNPLDVPIRRLT